MKSLVKKMKNKKGFTLMEMLIVVAIIVILVAVSIPVFSNTLGDAKEAADNANVRAARGLAATQYLLDQKAASYLYDAESGKLVGTGEKVAGYAQGSSTTVGTSTKGQILSVSYDADGDIDISWTAATESN